MLASNRLGGGMFNDGRPDRTKTRFLQIIDKGSVARYNDSFHYELQ
jgi:hypothetical protein